MALLTATTVTRAGHDVVGVTPTASTGDTFANTGTQFVEILNGSGAPITVSLDITATVDGAAVTDPTVTIAAGVTKIIGPFPTALYNTAGGLVKVTCSSVTSCTIKVLNCPAA